MKPVDDRSNCGLTMTVGELLTKLSEYPKDMPAIAIWDGCGAGIRPDNFSVGDRSALEPQLWIDVSELG